MIKTKEFKGIFLAIIAATIFGLHPTLVYFLRSEKMMILPTLFIGCIQCLIIYIMTLCKNKKIKSLKITKRQFIKLILSSILFYSTLGTLFYSFTLIPSGLASIIHFAYPSLVTIISIITKRDVLSKELIITLIFTFLGVLLVSNPSNCEINSFGILLAIISAFLYAGYIYMINDKTFKEIDNSIFVFYIALVGLVLLIIGILFENIYFHSLKDLFGTFSYLVLFGGLSLGITQGIGVFAFAKAIKYIGGPMGGALAAFEPLTAVIIGVIFFNENITISTVIGCLLILNSIIYLSLSKMKK